MLPLLLSNLQGQASKKRKIIASEYKYALYLSSGFARNVHSNEIDLFRNNVRAYQNRNIALPFHTGFPGKPFLSMVALYRHSDVLAFGGGIAYSRSGITSIYRDYAGKLTSEADLGFRAIFSAIEYDFTAAGALRTYVFFYPGLWLGSGTYRESLVFNDAERSVFNFERSFDAEGVHLFYQIGLGFRFIYKRLILNPQGLYQFADIPGADVSGSGELLPYQESPPEKMRIDFSGVMLKISLGVFL